MNLEMKKKWVEALRSGKYEQGGGVLCRDNGIGETSQFCCLGVLCDISEKGKWKLEAGADFKRYISGEYSSCTYLPQNIMNEYNIKLNVCAELAKMNDKGKSFEQIADHIEENL